MSEQELYRPSGPEGSFWDGLMQGFFSSTVEDISASEDVPDDMPDVVRNPLTGDWMISPRLQNRIHQELDGARAAVSSRLAALVGELSVEHQRETLCGALLEGAALLAICCFEEEALVAKWTELQSQGRDFGDVLVNMASGILLDRMIAERRVAQKRIAV